MLESELARQKEEVAQLKQQLAEGQSVEKERKRLAEKLDKLENKASTPSASPCSLLMVRSHRWTTSSKRTSRRRKLSCTLLTMSDYGTTRRGLWMP